MKIPPLSMPDDAALCYQHDTADMASYALATPDASAYERFISRH